MDRQFLSLDFETFAAPDLPPNSFRGMASVFGNLIESWIPTRLLKGAFRKTLKENAKRIKVLYQHDDASPIGRPTRLEEREDGLYIEARISDTTLGRDVLTLLRDQVLTELSIGFDPIRDTLVEEDIDGLRVKVRHISEVRLWEVSPVTFGANSKATISDVNNRTRARALNVDKALADLDKRWAKRHAHEARKLQIDYLDALGGIHR
jgi:hypothetical protein